MSKDKNPTNKSDKTQKEPESKAVKFKRVVSPRVNKALKAIKLIGNCSTKDYAYNEESVHKIFGTLYEQVKATENRFKGTAAADNSFSL